MIVPDPKVARTLLTRYATLRIAQAERETPYAARELADVMYTLCILMGTADVREAVAAADVLLEQAGAAQIPAQAAAQAGATEQGMSLVV
ncbi:DUF5133 domain-containing protein [Streptomyces sp. NBC_01275]|uniref:DUF5133 domain-containing protein n=1 Tax=Streptomyces sp. NBC_01275 TaxID=2903807 RepID=UPI00225320E5|nr:DUF5133 domain-containing protein [Streptomyces sp. NBC_01275]MCX4767130.1 DUF5133 domain-containing protein [Streptomyces sp. NBC_01275]